jgi:hypothetical protein
MTCDPAPTRTARESTRPVAVVRNRCTPIRPAFTASNIAPCPRRCSGARLNPTNDLTGPSVHNRASVNSNNASARRVRHR